MGHSYIIMLRSLTYAQRASRLLERAGIYSSLTKAPQGATVKGCSYGVKVQERHVDYAMQVLRGTPLVIGKTFRLEPSGAFSEVDL